MATLFRKEAIQALQNIEQGNVLLSKRYNRIYVFLVVLTLCLILAIGFLEYTRHVTIVGTLKSIGGAVKVFGKDSGIVIDIYVTEGDFVEQDQDIALVRLPRHLYQLNQTKRDNLQKQIELNLRRIRKQRKQYEQTARFISSQLELLTCEQEQLDVSISIQQQQVNLRRKQLEKARLLKNKASLSQRQLESYQENLHSEQIHLQRLKQEYQQKNTHKAAIQKELHLNQVKLDLQETELKMQNQEYTQAIKQLTDQSEYIISAPVAGNVTNLQMLIGQQTDPVKPVAFILADETEYFAELFFPSRHIGFITTNILVKLKLDAYPYQQYGMSDGVISEVSKTTMNFRDVKGLLNSTESMYRIRVRLTNQHVNYKGQLLALIDGMKVTAEVNLERRRLLFWLISPLYELSRDA